MNARAAAQGAASLYLSNLDVRSSHPANVESHLRGPVLALTESILLSDDVVDGWDEDGRRRSSRRRGGEGGGGGLEMESSDGEGERAAEDGGGGGVKKSKASAPSHPASLGSEAGWREYLFSRSESFAAASRDGDEETNDDANDDRGPKKPKLRRRAKARMEAFLAGCALAVPDDPLPPPPPPKATPAKSKKAAGGGSLKMEEGETPKMKGGGPPPASGAATTPVDPPGVVAAGGAVGAEATTLAAALSGFSVSSSSGGENDAVASSRKGRREGGEDEAKKVPQPLGSSLLRSISSASSSSAGSRKSKRSAASSSSSVVRGGRPRPRYPQMNKSDLAVRLELYVRSLRRVREGRRESTTSSSASSNNFGNNFGGGGNGNGNECVVALEPPRAVKARVSGVVSSFVATVGCVRGVSPVLTRLVKCLTCELLAVDALGEELQGKIRRLVLEYEHQTSFASLAFLSSPEKSAESHLAPLLTSYIQYLQSEWQNLVEGCELERMLRTAIDPDVRHTFKTVEFRSIGHLLEVCQEQSRQLLNTTLPPEFGGLGGDHDDDGCEGRTAPAFVGLCADPKAVKQALRDLRRETISVNGRPLPPAHSLKELLRLLAEALNSRTLTLGGGGRGRRKGVGRSSRRSARGGTATSAGKAVAAGGNGSDGDDDPTAAAASASARSSTSSCSEGSDGPESDFLSSGNEGDTDGSGAPPGSAAKAREAAAQAQQQAAAAGGGAEGGGGGTGPAPRRRERGGHRTSFDVGTIDALTKRLLVAASRTGAGGDAFFVVRDLFGGDEVEVVPARSQPVHGHSGGGGRMPRKASSGGAGTIELVVRLSSVTIKCHGRYDVYPKPVTDDCEEPLIQLHTTTTETISLHAVREADGGGGKAAAAATTTGGGRADGTVLVLQEKRTDATGWRTLSIRPARYEKVTEWDTPS